MTRNTLALLVLISTLLACDDGTVGTGNGPVRDAGGDITRPRPDSGGDDSDAAGGDTGSDVSTPDAAIDEDIAVPDVDEACDRDGDQIESLACGGTDCDDDDVFTYPGATEVCDFVDQDCDGSLNNGVECVVYAHSSTTLYLIDPFNNRSTVLGSVPGLFDLDTDRSGNLYGITSSNLYRYDATASSWSNVGSLGTGFSVTANGFAIDSSGRAWVTASNRVYNVDLGTAEVTLVGEMGDAFDFNSSGDCVVDKSDRIYMTSNAAAGSDELVSIDGRTGVGTTIGPTGAFNIYGLTAAWGYLFGFASGGQVVLIDPATGSGDVLHTFGDIIFYGAASSPGR